MRELIISKKNINIIFLVFGLFLVPTFLEHLINLGDYKQFVIGTIVNLALINVSLTKRSKKTIILLSFMPSLATMFSGLLFSGLNFYSKVMIPFIWAGNLSLIYVNKYLNIDKDKNYFISALVSLLIKVLIIYGGFIIISNALSFPLVVKNTLNLSMGLYQIITGLLAIFIYKIFVKHK